MDAIIADVRQSFRSLLRKPGFSVGVILILALGIGANTSVFSIVNAFLLRPLPFDEPDRLVHIWQTDTLKGDSELRISVPDFLDYQAQNTTLEDLGGYYYTSYNVKTDEVPMRVAVGIVTTNLIDLLGVEPILGRRFTLEDGTSGQNPVVLISERYWQRHLHGDVEVVGKQVTLDGVDHTVVGVMPHTFEFPLKSTRMWKPLSLDGREWERKSFGPLLVVGRMRSGIDMAKVQVDMNMIASRLEVMYPEANTGVVAEVVPLRKALVFFYDMFRLMFLMVFLATGFVTLIVCANVGNLLLARSMDRSREIAIRAALGAGRWRIVRQLFTESVCLALIGGVAGAVLAYWIVQFIGPAIPEDLYRVGTINIDFMTLGFTLGISLLVAVLFGLAPAFTSSRADLNQALRDGGRGSSHVRTKRLHSVLVVSEISLAMMLVVSSALVVRSFVNMQDVKPGFNPANVLTAEMILPKSSYEERTSWNNFYDEALRRIDALPQVTSAAAVYPLPMNFESFGMSFVPEGQPHAGPEDDKSANQFWVTPSFFETMEIPVLNGRVFTELDLPEGEPVIVINETMARQHWPDQNVIGKRVRLHPGDDAETLVTVVGVVGDIKHFLMTDGPTALIFFPQAQSPRNRRFFLVKTEGDPMQHVASVRTAINGIDPNLPLTEIRSMRQVVAMTLNMWGGAATAFGGLGLVALILSAIGLYSLISYSVGQRIQELGIRIALGARNRDVIGLVMRRGLWLTGVGVVLGALGAFFLTQLLTKLLFGISAHDPVTFISTAAVLIGSALLACYLPARRATRIDPNTALRSE